MIFTASISTALSTGETNPDSNIIDLRWGIIHRLEVDIPGGHNGLTGIRFYHAEIQKWPTTPGQWLQGNNVQIGFNVFHVLLSEPFFLRVETFNSDTTYNHIIHVRIGVLPPWAVYFTPKSQWDAWGKLLFE